MQKPSLGRVVLYQNPRNSQINTALIVGVHDDETITIAAWTNEGAPYTEQRVKLGGAPEGLGTCHWPPYVAPGKAADKPKASEPAGPQS